jgi:putative ABC transport system permease protein
MKVEALNGVSLNLRQQEFVSILGPSGCGKTTFLNILGGLDNYDSGDIIVNDISTKTYRDADWDAYRSHYVGFVFQSYNLIMHLTVLENVELALSIAGISKEERRKKALDALKSVGLEQQVHKKPNQLSGGQMQRVAIARAIVNDPQIILADEPTGALDTATSMQILDILKQLSKTRLVVMVTHNQELAEKYSTRIVRMLDGKIISDSKPFNPKTKPQEKTSKKDKKPSMKFLTALNLSFRNLLTKKTRTFLTSFAGSIGIIGIALILALSSGFHAYVNKTEQDTMTSYPISIEQVSVNMLNTLKFLSEEQNKQVEIRQDQVSVNYVLEKFLQSQVNSIHINDLKSFKTHIEQSLDKSKIAGLQYVYDVNLNVYKQNSLTALNPLSLSPKAKAVPSLSAMFNQMQFWQQLLDDQNMLESQYTLVGNSHWPKAADEIVIMMDANNQINDLMLYALGIKDVAEIDQFVDYLLDPINNQKPQSGQTWFDVNDFLDMQFDVLVEADHFAFDPDTQTYKDIRTLNKQSTEYQTFLQDKLQNNAIKLKVVGVAKAKDKNNLSANMGGIGYTSQLVEQIITQNNSRTVVQTQLQNPNINVFTNAPFEQNQSLQNNLKKLGVADLETPKEIRIYASNFESKDYIIEFIEDYNKAQTDNTKQIQYTDMVGLLISSVSTIINAITYVLIAFVSISLVVSSIMIGIITYVSVLERTKEIGILRSVGARKRDVANVFNAETLIVGFISGTIGILLTYLLSIPANIILQSLIGIKNVVSLQILHAVMLIAISIALTLISGLIPARIAAKKDPVKALRED